MPVHKNFLEIMKRFTEVGKRQGTWAELIDKGFQLIEQHPLLESSNQVLLGLKVSEKLVDQSGHVHNGAFCTILDAATAFATLKLDKQLRKNLSVEICWTSLDFAKLNDYMLIRAECLHLQGHDARTRADIFIECGLRHVGFGSHVQHLINKRFDEK